MKRILLLTVASALLLSAQPNANEFEVASIRPASADATGTRFQVRPGIFRVTNATLREMIAAAYGVREFQLTGGDSWVGTQRFDINAKMNETELDPAKMTPEELLAARKRVDERIRNLLTERFHLQIRREMRDQVVYALAVAKPGSKLVASTDMSKRGLNFRSNNGRITAESVGTTMEFLAQSLAGMVGRPVLDRTGLDGMYQFKAEWAQDMQRSPDAGAPIDGPTIFTALQEQLGLRLDSTRAPAEVIIIEHAERPSEN